MGNYLASAMDYRNSYSLVELPMVAARLKYGPVNTRSSPDEDDRSGIYRCANVSDEEHAEYCHEWYAGENVMQVLEKNCAQWPTRHAFAYRTVDKVTKEIIEDDKGRRREWEMLHLNEPSYISYEALWQLLTAFGKGAVETLGLQKGDRVALYEDTRWEWLTSVLGLWTQEVMAVTVYANLGQDALIYALKEADCRAIICNGAKIASVLQLMRTAELHDVTLVYLDELPDTVDIAGQKVVSWASVLKTGKASSLPYTIPRNNDAEVLVMYTSGTTGNPKGVVHTIGALTHGAKALSSRLNELIGSEEDETYVSYLPAAHIFEFTCQLIFLMRGVLIGFGSPRTLTDTSARPCGDITLYKPFFIIGVPRIFDTIKKTVESKLPPPGSLRRIIFDRAYASRLRAIRAGKDTPYWNEKVFAAARQLMGPRMRAICSGGAPLASKTQEFMNVVLGISIAQGYGMTETVCNCAVQRVGEFECTAGQCLRGVECRLLDHGEFRHTDKPHPRGELLIRGPFMFKGYYKQPKLTAEAMLPDGWLRTGDVAQIDSSTGEIHIIGRVKALAKNVLGEYIALEALESLYCLHPLVIPNGICLLVNSQKAYIAALVLTDESKAMRFAAEAKIDGTWPAILQDAAFQRAAAASLAALAKRERRMPFECVKYVRVMNEEWTPENGLMTASMKLRRSHIDSHYADVIAQLFAE